MRGMNFVFISSSKAVPPRNQRSSGVGSLGGYQKSRMEVTAAALGVLLVDDMRRKDLKLRWEA